MGAGVWYELGQRLVELTDAPLKRTVFSLAVAVAAALISVLVRTASDRSGQQGLDAVAVEPPVTDPDNKGWTRLP
jgi:hypothetical protein